MRVLTALALASTLAIACGSSSDDALFSGPGSGASGGGSGGDTTDPETGGASTTGGSGPTGGSGATGTGATTSGGSTTGGAAPTGGTSATGGTPPIGGSAGTVSTGGAMPLDGGVPSAEAGLGAEIPSSVLGLIVTQECADCAAQNCPTETAACAADQACLDGIACLNTCLFPPACAACFLVTGVTMLPTSVRNLDVCTTQYCPMCVSLGG